MNKACKRVLVFSSDILPLPGLPTSGGGLRSWQIIKGLEANGIDVNFSMPGEDRFLEREYGDKIPEETKKTSWKQDNQDEIVEHFKPDAIVFANPDLNCLKKDHGLPILSDMHGPRLIEFELLNNDDSPSMRGRNIRRKLSNFMRSDYFTCAGRWQRYYFLSYFMMAGYKLSDIRVDFMPVSLAPEQPVMDKDLKEKRFIYSGGFYPWQNPMTSLYAMNEALASFNDGALHVFGGSHNVNQADTLNFAKMKDDLGQNPRIKFRGYLSRDDVIEEYRTGYVAFEVMARNFEREMAFTTRTIEFMWAGLPVIYNDYADLSEYIVEYDAGWCVNPDDPDAIKQAIKEALNEPELVVAKGKNAQRLVSECFSWDKTIRPVLNYLADPVLTHREPNMLETPVPYILQGGDARDTASVLAELVVENRELRRDLESLWCSRSMKMATGVSKAYHGASSAARKAKNLAAKLLKK